MGNNPFYYHWNGREFIFASELAPVLNNPSTPKVPNKSIIAEYVANQWCSRDETLWSDVSRLVPAHDMVVSCQGSNVRRYWSPSLDRTSLFKTDREYIEAYQDLLRDCVRRASRSQNVIACDVSGGLDSSAIFCLAEGLRRSGRLPSPGIQGYTIDFSDDQNANEIAYARSIGQHLGLDIIEVIPFIPSIEYFANHARIWRDFPGFPNGVIDKFQCELMSSKQCRVLLTGLGGDEWLTGSPLYYSDYVPTFHWKKLYELLAYDFRTIGPRTAMRRMLRYGLLPNLPRSAQKGLKLARRVTANDRRNNPESADWLSTEFRGIVAERRRRRDREFSHWRLWPVHREQLQILELPVYQMFAEHANRFLALFQVEGRQPMRTHRFVQFAFSTPETLRLRGDTTKFIHREALRDIMPNKVITRANKAEFSLTFSKWLADVQNEVLGSITETRVGWVHREGIAEIYALFGRRPNHYWPMWVLWAIYGCHFAID
jgi:asparagine synthase (glutamine-hydrolysing)